MANESDASQSNLESSRGRQAQTAEAPPLRRPQFSLAGSHGNAAHFPSFIDPGYYDLNPDYNRPQDKPVWGLARPLPRVVRSGMRRPSVKNEPRKRTGTFIPTVGDHEHEPNTEATPQVAKIPTQISDSEGNGDKSAHSRPERHEQRAEDTESIRSTNEISRFGSPMSEIGDPMNAWAAPQRISKPQRTTTDGSEVGVHSLRRLPTVREVSSDESSLDRSALDPRVEEKLGDEEGDIEEGSIDEENFTYQNRWSIVREHLREPMAEGLATFVAILLGLSTNLSVLTSSNKAGTYQSSNWAGGLGFMVGIYIAGGISGGHLNPAISLTLCLFRGFPIRKAMIFIPAQIIGSFLAALVAFGIYYEGIVTLDGGLLNSSRAEYSGQAFLTGLQVNFSALAGFANEFVATGILAGSILALGDDENAPPGAGMHALIVGLVVVVLGMAFGYPTGACMNPARDLGPRLAALVVGYGGEVFTGDSLWWIWGGCVAPVAGGLFGGLLYDGFIFLGSESPVNYVGRKRRRKQIPRMKGD